MSVHNRIRLLCLLLAGLMLLGGCSGKEDPATQVQKPETDDLTCLEYSSYTGTFPEDGSGRQVENVAAMLVYNGTGEYLDYAKVECDIGYKTGTFVITGLPPGERVWVLEQNAMTLEEGESFQARPCEDPAYDDDAILSTESLSVKAEGNTLAVTNRTDKTLKNVAIYYKTILPDGSYFGGITYMLVIGDLSPGQTVTKQADHYGSESRIVKYGFQEE